MPARPDRTPRTSPHLFLFSLITLPAVKVTVQKPNRKSKRHLRRFVWFLANHLILKSFLFQNRLFQIHLAMTHVARCEIASGGNLPHYLVDKSQTWGGDSGGPNSPKRGSQVCANCLRDPYLSPPIKPISLGDTRISYFLPEQHESCPYFSVGGLWLDLLRHNPWLAHIWRAAAQIYFLLLISFSRTLLHPINFRL